SSRMGEDPITGRLNTLQSDDLPHCSEIALDQLPASHLTAMGGGVSRPRASDHVSGPQIVADSTAVPLYSRPEPSAGRPLVRGYSRKGVGEAGSMILHCRESISRSAMRRARRARLMIMNEVLSCFEIDAVRHGSSPLWHSVSYRG